MKSSIIDFTEDLVYIIQLTKQDLKIIVDSNKKVTNAFTFFSNTATQAAIKNANSLKKYLCDQ
jgi:hypothetical protein